MFLSNLHHNKIELKIMFQSPDRSWPSSRGNTLLNEEIVKNLCPHILKIPGLYSFLGVSGAFCPGFPRISPVRGFTGKVVPRWILDNIQIKLIWLLCLLGGSGDLAPGSPRISPVSGFTENESYRQKEGGSISHTR